MRDEIDAIENQTSRSSKKSWEVALCVNPPPSDWRIRSFASATMDYVDQLFERAADLAGSPVRCVFFCNFVLESSRRTLTQADHLKVIALLFLSIPLALIFPLLPPSTRSNLPHLFAFLPSVFFLWNVLRLRDGFVQLLASSLVTWVIVKLGVREKRGKRMPWVVFTFVMGHLAVK